MSEVLRSLDEPVRDDSGEYRARVMARLAADGMWEGWLEFVPTNRGIADALVSPAESRQPEREHLEYWAAGLSVVYAEGALRRARRSTTVRVRVLDFPAAHATAPGGGKLAPHAMSREPVLDPFEVGSRSLDILAQELGALGRARLLNIIDAYDMNPNGQDVQQLTNGQLIRFIVVAVEIGLLQRAR